jgi:hypothetical protein
MVDRMLGQGHANIVVMPTVEETPAPAEAARWDNGETVRLWPSAVIGSDEPTHDLRARRVPALNTRQNIGRLPRETVRQLMDGPGEMTAPEGVDPESIAAVRRIARHLNECQAEGRHSR